jgi:hypothetical protein
MARSESAEQRFEKMKNSSFSANPLARPESLSELAK